MLHLYCKWGLFPHHFPQNVGKNTGYENFLYDSGFRLFCIVALQCLSTFKRCHIPTGLKAEPPRLMYFV